MFKGQNGRFKLTGIIVILVMVLGIYATIYAYSDKGSENDSSQTYSGYMSMDHMLKESYLGYIDKDQVKDNEGLENPGEGKEIAGKDNNEEINGEASSENPPINEEEKKPAPTKSNSGKKMVVGYYSSWSAYSGFTPDKIDASKLTHINYAFADRKSTRLNSSH